MVNVTLRPIYPREGTIVPLERKAEHDEVYVEKSVKFCMNVV
jgi:hypothetical protein